MRFNLRAAEFALFVVYVAVPISAQIAPCGRTSLEPGGINPDERFLPSPVEHVKSSVVKALPAVDAKLTKREGAYVEAETDGDMFRASQKGFGSEGMKLGARGTFHIDLAPETQNGVAGTRLTIRFAKVSYSVYHGKDATPLADETVCLDSLLSATDPNTSPKGIGSTSQDSATHPVSLKAGTTVKVALANYFFTKEVPKNTHEESVTFEVVEDVTTNGVVVIRKGALVKGRASSLSQSKSFGRDASFRFNIDSATAVDGQEIALSGSPAVQKGTSAGSVAAGTVWNGLAFGLVKGNEGLVRAGTTWELPTAKDTLITAPQ